MIFEGAAELEGSFAAVAASHPWGVEIPLSARSRLSPKGKPIYLTPDFRGNLRQSAGRKCYGDTAR